MIIMKQNLKTKWSSEDYSWKGSCEQYVYIKVVKLTFIIVYLETGTTKIQVDPIILLAFLTFL